MGKIKNRRTLKKRVRRAMSLSAFITVVFLSGIIIAGFLYLSKGYADYQAEVIAETVQKDIGSGKVFKKLGITSYYEMNKENPKTQEWIDELNKSTIINQIFPYNRDITYITVRIEVHGIVVFSNEQADNEEIYNFYEDTKAERPINDLNGNEIGRIVVRVNPILLLVFIGIIMIVITVFGLAALIISKLVSILLIRHVINPIDKLEMKVRAIAEDDRETADNTEITLKKPLREIESLANSTNKIMKKLNGYNDILESQKVALENQNTELEAQNTELMESKAQIQQQQAQLIQSEKMASVGLLTAAITHEINTPIGAINSNSQIVELLLQGLNDSPSIQTDEALKEVLVHLTEVNSINLTACSRIIEIIRSLKSFSRLDQAEFQEANISEGIKSVLVLTNNLLKKRITVHEEYEDLPPVKCFPGQLNQVIMNILVNASQAIVGEGDIFIRTYQQDGFLHISIRDTGTGISPENMHKLFEPGFTTKGVGIGLGLGLYISYNIIQNHNGEILVNNEPGKGAEFIIRIPMQSDRT